MSPHDKLRKVIEDIVGKYYLQGQLDEMKRKGWLVTQQDVEHSFQRVLAVLDSIQTQKETE